PPVPADGDGGAYREALSDRGRHALDERGCQPLPDDLADPVGPEQTHDPWGVPRAYLPFGRDNRTLLTRDRRLAASVPGALCLGSHQTGEQLREVRDAFPAFPYVVTFD